MTVYLVATVDSTIEEQQPDSEHTVNDKANYTPTPVFS